jgi:hypothetical protein
MDKIEELKSPLTEMGTTMEKSQLHFYIQASVLIIALFLCFIGIILQPTGPNIQWFQSIATFCLGLLLPNPKKE